MEDPKKRKLKPLDIRPAEGTKGLRVVKDAKV